MKFFLFQTEIFWLHRIRFYHIFFIRTNADLAIFFSVLIAFILSYLSDDFYADAKQINTNEISHKSTRFNSFDYCEPGLCSSNKKHIACGNKGKFGHSCTEDARVIELDDFHKRLILYMHNVHRNTIAMGKTPGFEPAARMGALQWDDGELQKDFF